LHTRTSVISPQGQFAHAVQKGHGCQRRTLRSPEVRLRATLRSASQDSVYQAARRRCSKFRPGGEQQTLLSEESQRYGGNAPGVPERTDRDAAAMTRAPAHCLPIASNSLQARPSLCGEFAPRDAFGTARCARFAGVLHAMGSREGGGERLGIGLFREEGLGLTVYPAPWEYRKR